MGTDHAQTASVVCLSVTHLKFFRNHIKVKPGSICTRKDSFCTQDNATLIVIRQSGKDLTKLFLRIFMRSLFAPAGKYFICMMVMMIMVVIVAATGAVGP